LVEADPGITPTIAHVPTGIVHGRHPSNAGFEKVPAQSAKDWLHLQAAERKIDSLVSEKLASGEETCIDMPVLLDPDDDPTFTEPTRWRNLVNASRKVAEEIDLPF
jgi:hypothetical protein